MSEGDGAALHLRCCSRRVNPSCSRPFPSLAKKAPAWTDELRGRLDELLEEYRSSLRESLDGLSEDEARRSLVPSKTTLLGLVKHVTYVEGVWFDQAVNGGSSGDVGIAGSPARSFTLKKSDTIESVQQAHRDRCERSREVLASLRLDSEVDGRGDKVVWAFVVQVVREVAQHQGHADILREQILAARPA